MIRSRFDGFAPHYAWVETMAFGGLLQWCRTALLCELTDARRVLILGEGDGRFLATFLAENPKAIVDVVDSSHTMSALAQQRIARLPGADNRVRWHTADARLLAPPRSSYDLIVTNFFLDCFPAQELEQIMPRLAACLQPGGYWLVGDFAIPDGRFRRLAAGAALAGMYTFFKLVTSIPACWLTDPRNLLQAQGLTLEREKCRLGGFLVASLWKHPGQFT